MEAFLIYLGKVALAMCAFFLVFLMLFQKQKHFVFNRIYLLASMAISYLIPLITFTIIQKIEAAPILPEFSYNYFDSIPYSFAEEPVKTTYYWYHYSFAILLLGVAGFFIHFLIGNFKALNIVRKSYGKKEMGPNICITKEDVHPFSFFNKVIVSEKNLSHPNIKMIIDHEKLHVKEKHTFDILIAEILFLLEWFNPFAWLLKDAVKNNLEFLTDDFITQQNDRETYQLAMVSMADKKGVAPFLTALNGSQLKNRIIMMKKKTENKFAVVKQLLILPLLAILIMGLSNKEV
ncbi:MAG: M56 family metallopeptidase, partial [Prolixibacteraceae bacterium]|nr:M56 family metallopeptidase [Prolixibacteraceae bacterium]